MKLKKILSGMFIVALGVTSCTSEMPVDNQGEDGASALSVVLSVGDQATKAIDDPAGGSYGIATTKEIKINDFHVAIFDGTTNRRIDAMTVKPGDTGVQDATITDNGKKYSGYKVNFENVSTEDHKSVYAVVIANASKAEYDAFDICKEYSAYESVIIKTESFDASNLAKSGMSESKTISGNTNIELLVPLTQLSARIDFGTATAATKAGGNGSYVETRDSASVWSVVTSADGFTGWEKLKEKAEEKSGRPTTTAKSNGKVFENYSWNPSGFMSFDKKERPSSFEYWTLCESLNQNILSIGGFYYGVLPTNDSYDRGTYNYNGYSIKRRNGYFSKRILLVRKKVTTKQITTTTTTTETPGTSAGFKVQSVSLTGVNENTQSVFENRNTAHKYKTGSTVIGENTSFYTYEYPSDDAQRNLEITLTGYYQDGTSGSSDTETKVEEKILSEKWVYGIWVQSRGNGWGSVSTDPKGASAGSITWYDELTQDIPLSKSVSTASDNSLKSGEKIYTYKFYWSDLTQDGKPVTLQRGYRYKLDVVKVDKNDFELIVTKAPWNPIVVNVGYDSDKYK